MIKKKTYNWIAFLKSKNISIPFQKFSPQTIHFKEIFKIVHILSNRKIRITRTNLIPTNNAHSIRSFPPFGYSFPPAGNVFTRLEVINRFTPAVLFKTKPLKKCMQRLLVPATLMATQVMFPREMRARNDEIYRKSDTGWPYTPIKIATVWCNAQSKEKKKKNNKSRAFHWNLKISTGTVERPKFFFFVI